MSLPEKLLSLRKQNGFIQMELAEKLHVSRQAISRWEVGTAAPSTDNLKELSNLYDVSLDFLLGEHSEDISLPFDTQEMRVSGYKWDNKKMHLVIIALSLVLTIVIVICKTVVHLKKEEDNRIIPISELNCEEADNGYPTVIFTID